MSEELRLTLSKELREEKIQEITYNSMLTILAPFKEFLQKCLSDKKETCNIILNEALELINELGLIRTIKALKGIKSELSFDSKFLNYISEIVKNYYNILLGVEAPYDEYNRVLVKVLREFEYNGRILKKNNIVLLDVAKAVSLESLGFIKIYRIKVFK